MENKMYFFRMAITLGLLFLIIITVIKNIDYYSYCKLIENNDNYQTYRYRRNYYEFQRICKDIFKDFSDHIFLRYTFNLIYETIKPENVFQQMTREQVLLFIERIEQSHLETLVYNLQFFKLTNFVFYLFNLFIIFTTLGIFMYITIICLFIIFIYFAIEGYLNFYTDIKVNAIGTVSEFLSYMPLMLIKSVLTNAWGVISPFLFLYSIYHLISGFFKIFE